MPSFIYTARDQRGSIQTGQLDAHDEDEVVTMLQQRGLLVTAVSQKAAAAGSKAGAVRAHARTMHQRVNTNDQVLLCQQLATLVDAGVPLLRSLEVASSQTESRALLLALDEVRRDVAGGRTFRDALARHPSVFSGLWLNLVETGEASGHLGQSLQQLARHFESARHLQNEAMTALTYPMFLMGVVVVATGIFVYWVVPQITKAFSVMGGITLPPLTRFIIALSNAAQQYFVAMVLGVAGGVYLLARYLRTEPGEWMRDRIVLQIPLFKNLFSALQLAEFSRGLSTLLESGVPLLSSLEILASSATNRIFGQAINQVKDAVKEGKSMAEPMEQIDLFPPMAVQMVQVGEEVGELGKMVGRIATYFEERVETFITRMTRLFEPIAIAVVAVLVMVLLLAVFLPIFQVSTAQGIK